jgi:hypothetical protein
MSESDLASEKGVVLGHAILGLIEPHAGHERAWNRYYERDHLIAAGSSAPFTFSTQRWVATRRHKAVRAPHDNPIAQPYDKGSFLGALWIEKDRFEAQQKWVAQRMPILAQQGRTFDQRDVLTLTGYDLIGTVARDVDGVPPELALERRYAGVVLAWVERRPEHPLACVRDVLEGEILPKLLAGSPIAQALLFTPLPKADWWPRAAPQVPGVGDRILVFCFCDHDPLDDWQTHHSTLSDRLEAGVDPDPRSL